MMFDYGDDDEDAGQHTIDARVPNEIYDGRWMRK
jgi:hypothetical protein